MSTVPDLPTRCVPRVARARAGVFATIFSLAFAGGVVAACGDVTGLEATLEVRFDTSSVFPLTGSGPVTPTALDTPFGAVKPINSSGDFDVVFDLDAQRRVVIYPVKLIVFPLTGVNEIGLRKVEGSFESVQRAPTGTYETDEPLTVSLGEVVVIEARRNRQGDLCGFALSPNIYSKLVVDSVSTVTNAIWFRLAANPNCGFRSFAPGLPKN